MIFASQEPYEGWTIEIECKTFKNPGQPEKFGSRAKLTCRIVDQTTLTATFREIFVNLPAHPFDTPEEANAFAKNEAMRVIDSQKK